MSVWAGVWIGAAIALLVALVGTGISCARAAGQGKALVWMQLSGALGTMLLVVLAETLGRSIVFAVPLVFALMSFVGVVAFLRLSGGQL
ncbi:MAG: monovalent cation/H+ antiporter complex subunit F [Pseudonocardiaceae bacterium]